MISNALLKFAASHDWHASEDEGYVFGRFNDYCVTAETKDAITAFFFSVAGIQPEHLIDLTLFLEEERFALRLIDYEMTDNFLCIRAKDTTFSGTAAQIGRFLETFTDKMKALGVDPAACAICGKPAETESLYVGLYCHIHPECVHTEGVDFTAPLNEGKPETRELVVLEKDEHSDDLLALPAGGFEENKERILADLATGMVPERDAFLDDLRRLIAVPSVEGAPEPEAPFGRETVRALDVFLDIARRMGFDVKNVDNMAGYAQMGFGDEMVACVCHLDVVPAGDGWTDDPFALRLEGDRLIGRGVNDDKGPLLAALYAMKQLKDDPEFKPSRRIRLIAGLNEESGSACMAHYVQREEIPVAGFTADSSFPATYAEKGIARLRFTLDRHEDDAIARADGGSAVNMVPGRCHVTLKDGHAFDVDGVMAHGSRPELGENAISKAMAALADRFEHDGLSDPFVTFYLKAFGDDTTGRALGFDYEDETGATSVNAGLLSLDADRAVLTVDVRYPHTFPFDERLARLTEQLAADGIRVECAEHVKPLYLPKDSALITTLMDVYRELTGDDGEALAIGGGTYARAVPNICAFGPAYPGDPDVAHQAGEWTSLNGLLASVVIYREALRRLAEAEL